MLLGGLIIARRAWLQFLSLRTTLHSKKKKKVFVAVKKKKKKKKGADYDTYILGCR